MTYSTNLTKRQNVYYFSKRIPSDISLFFAKTHLFTSLKTQNHTTALLMALDLRRQADQLFALVRGNMKSSDINYILYGNQLQTQNPDTNEWISVRTITHANGSVEQITEIDHQGQTKEEIEFERSTVGLINQPALHPQIQNTEINTIKSVVERYISSKKDGGILGQKGIETLTAQLKLFQDFFGADTDIKTIKLAQAEQVKNLLLKLPPNRTKDKKYQGKSLQEIADMGDKPQALATAKGIIQKYSTFFAWAEKSDYVDKNYFYKMPMPKDNRKESEQRNRWSNKDLQSLFLTDIWRNHEGIKHPYYFWLPLLGLYTGARLNELAQLQVNDIEAVNGVLCFKITDENDGQKLKNVSSKRVVPIHNQLIELGFSTYVEQRKGHVQLFDGLLTKDGKIPRDGFSFNASKWFLRLRKKHQLTHVDFHGFRHTVADELLQKQIPEPQAMGVFGHKQQSITYSRYAKGLNVSLLKETVQTLDFSDAISCIRPWKV
ncbi:tyrosine-type recombinase/integrase [Vibrio campbellii]|uniref:tyrosine-type recombinase/integrase n=1 Tax=Vibrio campbellii TaxID=680 RepID=UPI003CE56AE4